MISFVFVVAFTLFHQGIISNFTVKKISYSFPLIQAFLDLQLERDSSIHELLKNILFYYSTLIAILCKATCGCDYEGHKTRSI